MNWNFKVDMMLIENPQLFILAILAANNGQAIYGRTRLMKLAYIIQEELKKRGILTKDIYPFQNYYYGPYSFKLREDLDTLVKNGLILHQENILGDFIKENIYRITDKGLKELMQNQLNEKIMKVIEEVKKKYNTMPLFSLVREVYKKYVQPTLCTRKLITT